MQQLLLRPTIHRFETLREFAGAFSLGEGDLIVTTESVNRNFVEPLACGAQVLVAKKYGKGEPSDEMAEAMYRDAAPGFRRVVAIGGGTVLDVAKLFALENPVPVTRLYDHKEDIRRVTPLVLVPTTCGTGSEVTNISILELKSRKTKLGLAADPLYPDDAVLIPELLHPLPFKVFATSSIDALVHATESSVSPKATPFTKLFGHRAIEMIIRGYQKIAKDGKDARLSFLDDFLLAGTYAGIAFGNAGCAAVHAMSYPLGGNYHVPHGESNYALFTEVFKTYMRLDPNGRITELNRLFAGLLGCGEDEVYGQLERLLGAILERKPLRAYGMTREDIDLFTDTVMTSQGRLMANNYTTLSRETVHAIYESLY